MLGHVRAGACKLHLVHPHPHRHLNTACLCAAVLCVCVGERRGVGEADTGHGDWRRGGARKAGESSAGPCQHLWLSRGIREFKSAN